MAKTYDWLSMPRHLTCRSKQLLRKTLFVFFVYFTYIYSTLYLLRVFKTSGYGPTSTCVLSAICCYYLKAPPVGMFAMTPAVQRFFWDMPAWEYALAVVGDPGFNTLQRKRDGSTGGTAVALFTSAGLVAAAIDTRFS